MAGNNYDVAVVGGGPAGSTTAALLAEQGHRVAVIERAEFPRYHIGESLTGTVGAYLRQRGLDAAMEAHSFPVKYGVKVVGSQARNEFFVAVEPEPTWQVRRDDFDRILLDDACRRGAEHLPLSAVEVLRQEGRVSGLRGLSRTGEAQEISARWIVDASGTSGFLSKVGLAGPRVTQDFGDQVAVFAQFKDCERDPGLMDGNTIIFYGERLHWAWFIPLSPDLVSVGVVMDRDTWRRLRGKARSADHDGAEAVLDWGLRHINPDLWRRCGGRERTGPVHVIRDYSYSASPFAGDGWLCVGDAHRFIDPIFSFGVAIGLHEAHMAADALHSVLSGQAVDKVMTEYQRRCTLGQDAANDVIRYFWRFPAFFGTQAQGRHREDIMRLFAGACYDEPPLPGLAMMRESLAATA